MEDQILHDLSSKIDSARKANNNHLPHRYVQTMLSETDIVCPWLTYDKVINYNRAVKTKTVQVEANRCVLVKEKKGRCVWYITTHS